MRRGQGDVDQSRAERKEIEISKTQQQQQQQQERREEEG